MNAAREIARKSMRQINISTAHTWAERAVAYRHAAEQASGFKAQKLWRNYEESRHEALEHAALVEDEGKFVGKIQRKIDLDKKRTRRRS